MAGKLSHELDSSDIVCETVGKASALPLADAAAVKEPVESVIVIAKSTVDAVVDDTTSDTGL